ncbi:hypothetical protein ACP275_14G282000 [Erythranthe tilingii]
MNYPFFWLNSTVLCFMIDMYVAVLFSVLRVRYRAGITTGEMLNLPKSPFIAIAFLESISIVSAMYAGAVLPGPAIPLLYQTFLVWQLVFSSILLNRRYSLNQILGCFLVAAGVVVAVTSGANNGGMFSGVGVMWPMLMIASSAFQAGASIVKESVFVDAATCLKGKSLDIFVVTSFGSGFQGCFYLTCLRTLQGVLHASITTAMLPGPAIPILNQTFLLWQLAFSMLILGRTYSLDRFAGSFLVAAGVVLAVTSGSEHDRLLSGVEFVWPAMMIASSAFQAVASILEESVFLDAATRLKGKLIDIFVVNSFGSGFQDEAI